MKAPKDSAELALVVKAIICGVDGCCVWDDRAAQRFRMQPSLPTLTPEWVKNELVDFINREGPVVQVDETRPEYDDRRFYYKVILPVDGLRHGLFIEIVLDDDDPDVPSVRIVNCHEQTR